MTMSSSVWDMVAVLVGPRTGNDMFLPMYWSIPARWFAPTGWVPTPALAMWVVSLAILALCMLYFWRHRIAYMYVACALCGAVAADTPYVVVFPALAWFVWSQSARFLRWVGRVDYVPYFCAPVRWLGYVFAASFGIVAALNAWQFGLVYVTGYARNAIAALRWDAGWHPVTCWKMDSILNDYVGELAHASAGRQWIFTDGLCDAGIVLASGGVVRAIPLVGGPSDIREWERRGFSRSEDLVALQGGAAGLLRAWVVDRPENLSNAVFQCGFTFLERESKGRLHSYGLVMRTKEAKVRGAIERSEIAERSVGLREERNGNSLGPQTLKPANFSNLQSSVRRLANRIVEFYEVGNCNPAHGGRIRNVRFCSMQWRVARALRRQAAELDRLQCVDEALADTELSERIDRLNPMAKHVGAVADSTDLRAFGPLTPREGLSFALSRANFALASKYARPILKDAPENPEANFAMAMSHMASREFSQAQHYFRIALKSQPDNPALLNNLAVASLELGDLDEAEANARAALKARPDDAAIKNTLRDIRSRRERGFR